MKTHELTQGSPEWLSYRAAHFNASDATAMMGVSPHKTRTQLLHELHTGLSPEVDAATQRRFDDGHRFEALARPLAEGIIGEDLYPVTGSEGKLSASFDGLSMCESIAFEHKTLNNNLQSIMIEGCSGADLDMQYQIQMEQQLMVSGAEKCLFMASKWSGDELIEERHCWYEPNATLRQDILQGWTQFAIDLADYVPAEVVVPAVAAPQMGLPAVLIKVEGSIKLADNLPEIGVALNAYIARININPETDQDFANLEATVKSLKAFEEALGASEENALAQVGSVDFMRKTVALYRELSSTKRILVFNLVKAEKENRRTKIISDAATELHTHMNGLNARLGKPYMPKVENDFQGVVKGLKSIDSMKDKVATELARCKIEANAAADRIQGNLTTLRELAANHAFLFADTAQIVLKEPDDLTMLVKSRISEHQAAEEKKAEKLRESIRVEEAANLAQAQVAQVSATVIAQVQSSSMEGLEPIAAEAAALVTHEAVVEIMMPDSVVQAMKPVATPATPPTLRLGQMADRLGFTITAALLSEMKFEPSATDKAAKLYHEAEWPLICAALVERINKACVMEAA